MPLQKSGKPAKARTCVHPSLRGGALSLPIVTGGVADGTPERQVIRRSRASKRRAIVLATVQGLMIAHVVFWLLSAKYSWFGGRTSTPVEPSESMEFVKHGLVNAGLIFFALALLSTLILGRWFCGWGCHVVMLQDFCGYIMKKMGVRPKPFRSRLLMYVPLLLALYMFVWPAAYRWGVVPVQQWLAKQWTAVPAPPVLAKWDAHFELTTTEFWRTFPGVLVAIPFLLVCGFGCVYFLGAKGFCTYGCPYGGFFAPLDKYAPGRIIVNDDCEQCGHCTAVCTSNVRVHDEVREFGMVVDPGCMKCLDCVSVCPKDALSFGFARPAVLKGAARFNEPVRRYDFTWREEIAFAGIFAITFFSVRGVYGLIPMLMAAGVAGCVTYMAWKLWRMFRTENVTLHRFQLRLRGRVQRAGAVFSLLTLVLLAVVVHSGVVKSANALGQWHDDRVLVPSEKIFAGDFSEVTDQMRDHASRAMHWYSLASFVSRGGIGLSSAWQPNLDVRRAWLHCVRNEFDQAESLMREACASQANEANAAALAMILRSRGDPAKAREALEMYERLLKEDADAALMLNDYEAWALSMNPPRIEQVMQIHRARLQHNPRDVRSLRSLAALLLDRGNVDEAIPLVKRWAEHDGKNPDAHFLYAQALYAAGLRAKAFQHWRTAADLLEEMGRIEEARFIRNDLRNQGGR